MSEPFVCPVCSRRSYHPNDIAQGYCGACHDWTGELLVGPGGRIVSRVSLQEQPRQADQVFVRYDLSWLERDGAGVWCRKRREISEIDAARISRALQTPGALPGLFAPGGPFSSSPWADAAAAFAGWHP